MHRGIKIAIFIALAVLVVYLISKFTSKKTVTESESESESDEPQGKTNVSDRAVISMKDILTRSSVQNSQAIEKSLTPNWQKFGKFGFDLTKDTRAYKGTNGKLTIPLEKLTVFEKAQYGVNIADMLKKGVSIL